MLSDALGVFGHGSERWGLRAGGAEGWDKDWANADGTRRWRSQPNGGTSLLAVPQHRRSLKRQDAMDEEKGSRWSQMDTLLCRFWFSIFLFEYVEFLWFCILRILRARCSDRGADCLVPSRGRCRRWRHRPVPGHQMRSICRCGVSKALRCVQKQQVSLIFFVSRLADVSRFQGKVSHWDARFSSLQFVSSMDVCWMIFFCFEFLRNEDDINDIWCRIHACSLLAPSPL